MADSQRSHQLLMYSKYSFLQGQVEELRPFVSCVSGLLYWRTVRPPSSGPEGCLTSHSIVRAIILQMKSWCVALSPVEPFSRSVRLCLGSGLQSVFVFFN